MEMMIDAMRKLYHGAIAKSHLSCHFEGAQQLRNPQEEVTSDE
jgi:hypothetical protein